MESKQTNSASNPNNTSDIKRVQATNDDSIVSKRESLRAKIQINIP
jgi:hypothetical protein